MDALRQFLDQPMIRLAGAALAGLVLAFSFPPYGLWPLATLSVAALSLLTRGRSARAGALHGLVFGLAFSLILLDWMRVIGVDAWVLISVLEALFFALLGAGLAVTAPLRWWPLAHAALWAGAELLRARIPFGGFPWGRLAFGQADTPLTPYAAVGGAPLVTAMTAVTGALLAYGIAATHLRRTAAVTAAVGGILAVPLVALAIPIPTGADREVTVALVQGNVPRLGLDAFEQRRAVVRNHIAATEDLARQISTGDVPQPEIVLWPENSTDIDPYDNAEVRDLIQAAVTEIGVPTLVGAVVDAPDGERAQNVGIVWDPTTGPGETYVKRHPVPFGEYIPFRSLLERYITRLDRVPRDFAPGDEAGVLDIGPARLGDVICFEIAYDGLVRDAVTHGGEAIVVQTNNATYGQTGQTEQQFAISRLRAVEHGRSVLIAATSGISAVIAPDGSVVERSAEFTQQVLVRPVGLRDGRTIADRLGAWPEWLIALAGGGAVALVVVASKRGTLHPTNSANTLKSDVKETTNA